MSSASILGGQGQRPSHRLGRGFNCAVQACRDSGRARAREWRISCCDFMCAAEHLVEIASYLFAEHDVGEVPCLGDARDRFGREGLVLSEIG
jgi:hypothetical protein